MIRDHRHVKVSTDGSAEMAEFSLSEDDLRRFQKLDRSSYTSRRAVTAGRSAPRSRARSRPDARADLCPQDHDRSRVRDQGPMAGLRAGAYARLIMSADTDSIRTAAADAAAAPLDLLLTDAATGMLRRVNPGGSGLRLAAALAAGPGWSPGAAVSCSASWAASPWGVRRCSRPGATAGSPTRDGRATRCCAARCRPTWPPSADRGGRGGRGRPGRGRLRTRRLRADQPDRRAGPEQ